MRLVFVIAVCLFATAVLVPLSGADPTGQPQDPQSSPPVAGWCLTFDPGPPPTWYWTEC